MAQKSKSGYRGLTPAEYAAYGGIKTFAPAFGISSSQIQTEEEVKASKDESAECKTPSQEPTVRQSPAEVTKAKETPKDAPTQSIPTIIVSQASDTSGTKTPETSTVSSHVAVKQDKTVIQETPKAKPPAVVGKILGKPKVETPIQEVSKPKTTTPAAKQPLPKGDDQDPLKAVRKLLGKDKVQTVEQKIETEPKAAVSDQKAPVKPEAATKAKAEVSKPSAAAPADSTGSEDKTKDKKEESAVKSTPEKQEDESLPAAEPLLKAFQKPKGMKSKMSGWSRLKKHMVVEQEEPKFPEVSATEQDQKSTEKKGDEAAGEKVGEKVGEKADAQLENQSQDAPKATKMWDAVLFQMFSTKENIMHQIELSKSEEEKGTEKETQDELTDIPSFAYRLPVLLFSPKFDAKKLKEAASRPVTKISTVFEMGLIGRKGKDEEPKDFNRKARGFTAT